MDVMGGIADYSGSLVLQMPIHESTKVRVRLRNDFQCAIASKVEGRELTASIDYSSLLKNGKVDYQYSRDFLKRQNDISWSAYVLGCVLVLHREKEIDFQGADFEIESSVPLGKGVSSSASIEVAVMKSLEKAFQLKFSGTELPRLAQMAENLVVGAPCGLMDQLACYFGQENELLPIICQPDKLLPLISLPDEIHFMGIDSGVRHSVGGSSYTDVRCGAFMGYTIIAKHLGTTIDEIKNVRLSGDRSLLPFAGYLANISVAEFESKYENLLPERMSGAEFTKTFNDTIDPITNVKTDTVYSIRASASHPVYENDRVNKFMEILKEKNPDAAKLGELMVQSHKSYSVCGLGSDRTDEIVEEFAKFSSVAGAKITGGGSGGTVCALALGDEGINDVLRVHSHFSKKYRTPLKLFK
jgi:galactokinase